MKILTVVDSIWPPAIYVGGVKSIYELQKKLQNIGAEIHILTLIESWADPLWKKWFEIEEKKEGIQFHFINVSSLDRLSTKLCYYASKALILPKVLELTRKYHFDVIHEYSSSPLLFWRTSIYSHIFNVRSLHTLCTYNTGFFGSPRLWRGALFLSKVISTTRHMKKMLLQEGCPINKILYLPIGIDCGNFNSDLDSSNFKYELKFRQDTLVVLTVGPIESRKGIFTLVKAIPLVLKRYQHIIFLFVTYKFPSRNYNRNRAKLMNILTRYQENIRILEGLCNIRSIMALADVVVIPQLTPHGTLGYPLTLLEAMASGKAIVASNTVGINELISNGKNGLLFPRGDESELAKAICRLSSSRKLREKIGSKAKRDSTKYDINVISKKLYQLYMELLASSKR